MNASSPRCPLRVVFMPALAAVCGISDRPCEPGVPKAFKSPELRNIPYTISRMPV